MFAKRIKSVTKNYLIEKQIMKLKVLVGNGRKIGLFTLPFLITGIPLNIIFPEFFSVNGSSGLLLWISLLFLPVGFINWIWTVALILIKIPRKQLITTGPYAIVKHPLYVGVALLILPWVGLMFNTWLGIVPGIVVYIGSGIYSPEEEKLLSRIFGIEWENYSKKVKFPWI
ncbi:MAG: isoprenylcysteine carboxylmethyltransferase family protein [Lentimicrobium sp.]